MIRQQPGLIFLAIMGVFAAILVVWGATAWGTRPHTHPTPSPQQTGTGYVGTPVSVDEAQTAAVAFAVDYWRGYDVRSKLTPAERRTVVWQTPPMPPATPITVVNPQPTAEGQAQDGSLGYVVTARVNGRVRSMEVFVVQQGGRDLIESADIQP